MKHRLHQLVDKHTLRTLFARRAWLGFVVIVLMLSALWGRFFWLQVVHHADYQTQSRNNRIRVKVITPPRGRIFDRNGEMLAYNQPVFRLEVIPERVPDLDAMLEELRRIVPITDAEIERFKQRVTQHRVFDRVTLKVQMDQNSVDRFAVNRWRFPGVDLISYLKRRYPHADAFAHAVGYVGRINKEELEQVDKARYKGTQYYGKSGIERYYEDILHGRPGYEIEEVNVDERVVSVQEYHPPTAGSDIKLTLDVRLQQAAVDALDGRSGAVVAIDPRNGEVLAMVSQPSFDPNQFVNGISQKAYNALLNDPEKPLLHRVIRGHYPPGSTIKPFVGLAGLELGFRTPTDTTLSTGIFHIPGYSRGFRDDQRWGAGRVNVVDAIARSVNTYFYKLAYEMGIDTLSEWLAQFGFGQKTGIDLYGESVGVLPSSAWKRSAKEEPWYPGETVIAGIGQGYWVVTPMQLARANAILANGGRALHPRLLLSTDGKPDEVPTEHGAGSLEPLIVKDPANWEAVNEGMLKVVYGGPGSTARGLGAGFPYMVAGKTGTAERFSRKTDAYEDHSDLERLAQRHRALFVAYTPANAAEIAVSVIIDQGAWGGSTAGPVARQVLDAWLETQHAALRFDNLPQEREP